MTMKTSNKDEDDENARCSMERLENDWKKIGDARTGTLTFMAWAVEALNTNKYSRVNFCLREAKKQASILNAVDDKQLGDFCTFFTKNIEEISRRCVDENPVHFNSAASDASTAHCLPHESNYLFVKIKEETPPLVDIPLPLWEVQPVQEEVLPEPAKFGRRGRPKGSRNRVSGKSGVAAKTGRKPGRPKKDCGQTNGEVVVASAHSSPRKRGRPKKTSLDSPVQEHQQEANVEWQAIVVAKDDNENECVDNATEVITSDPLTKKKARKSLIVDTEKMSKKKVDDRKSSSLQKEMPIVEVSSVASNTWKKEDKRVSDKLPGVAQRKRGRPRKEKS